MGKTNFLEIFPLRNIFIIKKPPIVEAFITKGRYRVKLILYRL